MTESQEFQNNNNNRFVFCFEIMGKNNPGKQKDILKSYISYSFLKRDLSNENWTDVFTTEDVSEGFDNSINTLFKKNTKTIRIKPKNRFLKEWITTELITYFLIEY